eukprot:TRINITY_DN4317_c0_g1_i2.p1 TRINITY_DN4317_c0_g1~~TRINITY_DN4317_c0_g1_i2.p1  ORF type:complete len:143 (+),score=22.50 TRINITY_DN4317_c0_g1_i2:159-587(+)
MQVRNVPIKGNQVKTRFSEVKQDRLRGINMMELKGAHAIFLVYDLTNQESFEAITPMLREIARSPHASVPRTLIGTKADLDLSERVVEASTAQKLANSHNMPFYETSARDGINIEQAYVTTATAMIKHANPGAVNSDEKKQA